MDIFFIECDDWVQCYIDNNVVYEGHSMTVNQLLNCLGIQYQSLYTESIQGMEQICRSGLSLTEALHTLALYEEEDEE